MEDLGKFTKRMTCGRDWVDGVLTHSSCLLRSLLGKGNPNYKGIMPKCQDCGKRLYTYPSKKAKGELCKPCYVKRQQWVRPEHLKPFMFKKHKED